MLDVSLVMSLERDVRDGATKSWEKSQLFKASAAAGMVIGLQGPGKSSLKLLRVASGSKCGPTVLKVLKIVLSV